MPIDAAKIRVLIPTTHGPVEVLLLTEEDSTIGRSVACIGGTTEIADIAAAYHAFVVRPTGVIEGMFGHACYRLDISGRIDAGSSWQLGVLAAHALRAAGRLAQENVEADAVIWVTGSVRSVDLTVGGVQHVPEKLSTSMDRLKRDAAAGRRVILAVPEQNGADLSAAARDDLSAHGIDVVQFARVQDLFATLALKRLAEPQKSGARSAALPHASVSRYRRIAWGMAATLCVVLAGLYALGRPPATTAANPEPTSVAQSESKVLVPELVPFINERDQNRIRDVYLSAPDHKALAISASQMSFVTAQLDQDTADKAAVATCQKIADEQRVRSNRTRTSRCELYASGNVVVASRGRPPMPEQPWFVRDSGVERPFVAADVPLVSKASRQEIETGFALDRKFKALALSPTGVYNSYGGQQSVEQAVRRALERCGYNAGIACVIVAIDDNFVVPVPRLTKVVGFFRSGTIERMAPELRGEVARRMGNAAPGWNAVAVGASGRTGIKLGADSEQTAIDGAVDLCNRQDRECHVAVIGPFLVERISK